MIADCSSLTADLVVSLTEEKSNILLIYSTLEVTIDSAIYEQYFKPLERLYQSGN
jgi:hypothetical protein